MTTFEFLIFEGDADGVSTSGGFTDGDGFTWEGLKDAGEIGYELVAVTPNGNGRFHFFMQYRNEDQDD